jgi:HD-GYP domain-containing protein (c-di-GMP phosphodiesterase class II)
MLERAGGLLGEIGPLVRSCHEHWDGNGYPDAFAGEEIPLVARIICTCDAWSAMTTDRPYRRGLSHEEAVDELRKCAGTQFDPRVVDALLDALDA